MYRRAQSAACRLDAAAAGAHPPVEMRSAEAPCKGGAHRQVDLEVCLKNNPADAGVT
jgi:hypothetical protein